MNARVGDWLAGGSQLAVQAVWPPLAIVVLALLLFLSPGRVVEVSTADFFVVTVFLGGGAAWLSGKAVAETWRPYLQLIASMLLLAAAVRFIHYALFAGTLLSVNFYLIDFAVLAASASLGYRRTRVRQMTAQYGWLYVRHGLLGWSERTAAPAAAGNRA